MNAVRLLFFAPSVVAVALVTTSAAIQGSCLTDDLLFDDCEERRTDQRSDERKVQQSCFQRSQRLLQASVCATNTFALVLSGPAGSIANVELCVTSKNGTDGSLLDCSHDANLLRAESNDTHDFVQSSLKQLSYAVFACICHQSDAVTLASSVILDSGFCATQSILATHHCLAGWSADTSTAGWTAGSTAGWTAGSTAGLSAYIGWQCLHGVSQRATNSEFMRLNQFRTTALQDGLQASATIAGWSAGNTAEWTAGSTGEWSMVSNAGWPATFTTFSGEILTILRIIPLELLFLFIIIWTLQLEYIMEGAWLLCITQLQSPRPPIIILSEGGEQSGTEDRKGEVCTKIW